MEVISTVNKAINGLVWGLPMLVLIFGAGVYLSVRCGFPQFSHFGHIMKNTLGRAFTKTERKRGAISPFQAMCTALAASIGTGNIAGVSSAIAVGGPGAVFWMWISALFGMCTKFSEVTLAVKFRERDHKGDLVGGPMYYIKNGLGGGWKWLGSLFAVLGALAAFGIGNMTQINTIAGTVNSAISQFTATTKGQQAIIAWAVSVICAVIVAVVLLGGIQRLAGVCSLLVPVMAVIYIAAALTVILVNIRSIPEAFGAIFRGAFHPSAIGGGLAGAGIKTAVAKGVGRGVFSNEAGMGSAPMAHAAADVDHPVRQGIYGVFEVFIDTIVVCTMTALVVLLGVGVHNIPYGTEPGAQLTINGFMSVFPGKLSAAAVAACLALFALSTVLTWSLYGARCVQFLAGDRAARVYQIIFCLFACIAGAVELELAWNIADTLNALMAIPNLIALFLLSPVVARLSGEYFSGVRMKTR